MVVTNAQLHSTNPELTFCAGSIPIRRVLEIRNGDHHHHHPHHHHHHHALTYTLIYYQ